jgi:hypothetical protein
MAKVKGSFFFCDVHQVRWVAGMGIKGQQNQRSA